MRTGFIVAICLLAITIFTSGNSQESTPGDSSSGEPEVASAFKCPDCNIVDINDPATDACAALVLKTLLIRGGASDPRILEVMSGLEKLPQVCAGTGLSSLGSLDFLCGIGIFYLHPFATPAAWAGCKATISQTQDYETWLLSREREISTAQKNAAGQKCPDCSINAANGSMMACLEYMLRTYEEYRSKPDFRYVPDSEVDGLAKICANTPLGGLASRDFLCRHPELDFLLIDCSEPVALASPKGPTDLYESAWVWHELPTSDEACTYLWHQVLQCYAACASGIVWSHWSDWFESRNPPPERTGLQHLGEVCASGGCLNSYAKLLRFCTPVGSAASGQVRESTSWKLKSIYESLAAKKSDSVGGVKLTAAIRQWLAAEIAKVRSAKTFTVKQVRDDVYAANFNLSNDDVLMLATWVMFEAYKSTEEDLKATMDGVKRANKRTKNTAGKAFSPCPNKPCAPSSAAISRDAVPKTSDNPAHAKKTNLDRFDLGPTFVSPDTSSVVSRTARGAGSSKTQMKAVKPVGGQDAPPPPLPSPMPIGGIGATVAPDRPK